ncbi:podoplanin isoform X3 [Thunnus albacares]|uniref:podoplanin isoform X3 n=1 Tax=Thunnus albacares TaxID=8236 RepID=UPI001CF6623B|nr:podoplanin isoform X3 [Thunnus albacares]
MNVQLLLLLALAGPFCAFTHASPTGTPTGTLPGITTVQASATDLPMTTHAIADETTVPTKEDLTFVTNPPITTPAAAPEAATDAITVADTPSVTKDHVSESDTPVPASTAASQPLTTHLPVVKTEAPSDPAKVEDQTEATGAAEEGTGDEVVVEEGTEDGLSSGQVVGIVIGALLAVVIVIAVVIAVVRRMGKYSSAKNKKPAKKDSAMVSPLRKKSAKQQERSKFWKF